MESKNSKINKRQSRKFLNNFENINDNLINAYSCALQKNTKKTSILLHGTLFITNKSFAFYSNFFGYQTKIIGKWIDIVDIKKDNIAILFPTAIKLINKNGNSFVFASFISRNLVFNKMISLWHTISNENVTKVKKCNHPLLNEFESNSKELYTNENILNNIENDETEEVNKEIKDLQDNQEKPCFSNTHENSNHFPIIQCQLKKLIFFNNTSVFSNNLSFLLLLLFTILVIIIINFFVIFLKVNSIENKLLLFVNKE